uniref:Integrase n=1 Tax=Solanum tuberosum TaxID=4113 RepID=M1DCS6_SOLTU
MRLHPASSALCAQLERVNLGGTQTNIHSQPSLKEIPISEVDIASRPTMQSAPSQARKGDLGTSNRKHTPSPATKRGLGEIAEIIESTQPAIRSQPSQKERPRG